MSWILTAKPDMNHLFNDTLDGTLFDRLSPHLQIVESPEDAVGPLEFDSSGGITPTSSHSS